MNNTLFDVLGILIAFASVMLLLSLIVTGLVQGTQSLFRVRARNLEHGVGSFLEAANADGAAPDPAGARNKAAELLNAPLIASVDRVTAPTSTVRRVLGPRVTWAPAELLAHQMMREGAVPAANVAKLDAVPDLQPAPVAMAVAAAPAVAVGVAAQPPAPVVDPALANLVNAIRAVEPAWSKRFEFIAKVIALGWALIVAVAFQVSATELFSSLVRDPKTVQAIVERRNEVLGIARESGIDFDQDSDRALDQLAAKYPAHKSEIDQAGNDGMSTTDLVQQLGDVLGQSAERQEMLDCYGWLLQGKSCDQDNAAAMRAGVAAVDELAYFGIGLWSKGDSYYYGRDGIEYRNIFGVLVTALFLSFGAPFWFNLLKNLSALRDARSAKDKERNSPT